MSTRRSRRSSRRRGLVRASLLLLAGAALFVAGLGLGRATRATPEPALRTQARTLQPSTIGPPARTVTVTVTGEG